MAKYDAPSTPEPGPGELLAVNIAGQKQRTLHPLEELLTGQFEELLKTGGVGAYLPIITRALERIKKSTSDARSQVETQLAQQGLGGTPFAGRTLAEILMQGELAEANVPTDFFTQVFGQIPGYVTGQGQAISGLLAPATAAGAQRGIATMQAQTALEQTELGGFYQMLSALAGLGQNLGSAAAAGSPGSAGS